MLTFNGKTTGHYIVTVTYMDDSTSTFTLARISEATTEARHQLGRTQYVKAVQIYSEASDTIIFNQVNSESTIS